MPPQYVPDELVDDEVFPSDAEDQPSGDDMQSSPSLGVSGSSSSD